MTSYHHSHLRRVLFENTKKDRAFSVQNFITRRIATNMFPFEAHCLLFNVIIFIYTRTHAPLRSLSYTHLLTLRVLQKKNFFGFLPNGSKKQKVENRRNSEKQQQIILLQARQRLDNNN